MSLKDLTILEFLNEVDSKSPAPGGGSVSALTATLGVALTRMVGHLTLNRKGFFELSDSLQNEYKYHFNLLCIIKEKLLVLMDEDTNAFNKYLSATKLPKNNDEEISVRKEAIDLATIETIQVPLEVANLSYKALEVIEKMVNYGNKNAISDIGVGVILIYAGIEGAILNVKINLSGLQAEQSAHFKKECQDLINRSRKIKDEMMLIVNDFINL
ncbi:MAG: formimidoyltetrahydrofolate cyclodeaminase [Haloplasmataceae bacterium]|jgi:formiminotetrahydrofolate cyclodeaminase|nr:formimidoyltetrahydrofolate cyclodeaminase [Haloplasmataceae bacterium]